MRPGDTPKDRGPNPAPAGRPHIFWVSTLLVTVASLGFAYGAVILVLGGAEFRDPGWTFETDSHGGVRVVSVRPGGAADGVLRDGDRITAIDAVTEFESHGLEAYLATMPENGSYELTVDGSGGGEVRVLRVETRTSLVKAGGSVVHFIVGLSFLIVGALFGLARREVHRLQMGVYAFISMAILYLGYALEPYSSSVGPTGLALLFAATFLRNRLPSVLAFHFFSEPFGDRSNLRIPLSMLATLYAIVAALTVPTALVSGMTLRGGVGGLAFFATYETPIRYFSVFSDAFGVTMILAMMLTTVYGFNRALTSEYRRRLKWMATGIVAGCLPVFLVRFSELFASSGIIAGHSRLVDPTIQAYLTLSFVLVPASIAYAVLKNRLFDIAIVVRQSVTYALARGVMRSVVVLPAILILWRTWEDRNLTISELLFRNAGNLILASIAIVALRFRTRLLTLIDRRFFREAYNTEQMLLGLIEAIRASDSIREVSTMASDKIREALHPVSCHVVFRDRDSRNVEVTYSSGEHTNDFILSKDSSLLRVLEGEQSAQTVDTLRERLPEGETDVLSDYGIELVVPVTGRGGRSVGAILLGEKASEERYSKPDRRLLESVAAQMAIVFENALLRERVAVARRERAEVLGRVDTQGINLVRECPVCGRCFDAAQSVCSDDGAQLAVTLPVERTIDGKYRLDHLIGRGGMGAVYRGTDVRLGREVAIKVLTGALFGDQAALRRFEREAQASARLSHVNIVTVFDYGSLGTDGAYLVMEYVKGKTLRHELRRDTSLAPERIAFIIDGVCDAVAEAHKAGVIHRDLKPENILLTDSEDPRHQLVKVLDFGIAKVLTEGNSSGAISSITVPGSIMGTFGYMSPEQLEGRPVDVRTDVFALGVIVIEALTGSRPFSGSTIPALAASMAADGVEINLVAPEMSETIDVLRRSVSHDPDRRHGTVDEFRDAIMKALRLAEGGAKPVAGPGEEPDAPTVFVPSSPAGATELRSSERPAEDDFPVTEVIGSGPEPAAPAAPAVQGQTDTGNEPEAQ